MTTLPAPRASLLAALPYWVSLLTLPLAAVAALAGGWWVLLLPDLGSSGIDIAAVSINVLFNLSFLTSI